MTPEGVLIWPNGEQQTYLPQVTDVHLYVIQQLSKGTFTTTLHLRHDHVACFTEQFKTRDCWHWTVENAKFHGGFKKPIPFSHLFQVLFELEKKSSLVTRALSAKSYTRDTDSLHSCTRLRVVQEMACPYHSCKILRTLPRQWSLITISQDNHSFHPMFQTDHCRLVSIFRRKVRWRSEHVYTHITDTCRLT